MNAPAEMLKLAKPTPEAIDQRDKELRELCTTIERRFKLIWSPYWTAEIYGFGLQLSRYGFYPYCLPLCVYTDHGPGYYNEIPKHELESDAPVQLYHSPVSLELWRKASKKRAYCMFSPTVYYRRRKKIKQSPDAKGTIIFPAHSTPSIDDLSGYKKYIQQLKRLPVSFHPMTVCMHMHDIKKGLHLSFLNAGFEVVSAGNGEVDQRFIERLYNILKQYKYGTSNILGSYMFYSIEMGIPFFLYGSEPSWHNHSDENVKKGQYAPWEDSGYRKTAKLFTYELFYGQCPEITNEQRVYVHRHLGLDDGISRIKMAWVLYSSFFIWLKRSYNFKNFIWNNAVTIKLRNRFRWIKKFKKLFKTTSNK